MQEQDETHEINNILYMYVLMNDAYLDQRKLILEGNLTEIKYEDLEKDKNVQIVKIFEVFNLPCSADIEQGLINQYKLMPEDLRLGVADAWERNFEPWNYQL